MKKKFRILEHTADGMFQAYGITLEEAFKNSVYAMLSLITKNKIKERIKIIFSVNGKNLEQLLYNFLEEILILIYSKNFIPSKIKKIKIDKKKLKLKTELIGDETKNYEIFSEIKAITYNNMIIKKSKNKYIIQVVVDM